MQEMINMPLKAFEELVDDISDPVRLSPKAKALQACKDLRGCSFAECVEKALGRVPVTLKIACPEKYPEVRKLLLK